MKFLFNLFFYSLLIVFLLPIINHSPVKTLTFIGVFLAICVILGILLGMYRNKQR